MKNGFFKAAMLFIITAVFVLPAYAGGSSAEATFKRDANGIPEYLNTGTVQPIVKPGYDVTLRILSPMQPQFGGKAEDLWFWEHVRRVMNIKVDVEQVMTTAMAERRALLFATGDLPDIMMELNLSTADFMNFGARDGQLMDISKHMSPLVSPWLIEFFERDPVAKAAVTTPTGGMYVWPTRTRGGNQRLPELYVNMTWLNQIGLSKPNTLDEFYNMLVAFRDRDPSGTGRIIPLSGFYEGGVGGPSDYILSAYGFLITKPIPRGALIYTEPTLRNDKVEIPAGSPVFKDFLMFMNRLYREGLLDNDYYTDDTIKNAGKLAEGRVASRSGSVGSILGEPAQFQQWEPLSPVIAPPIIPRSRRAITRR